MASTVKIASIYFAAVKADRSIYGGMYEMPAVTGANDPPVILEIGDKVQHEEGPFSLGSNGKRLKRTERIFAIDIANDIVREWAQSGLGMTPDCHPGIWVVRETLPQMMTDPHTGREVFSFDVTGKQEFRQATEEEKARMWNEDYEHAKMADHAYANFCFMDGNARADDVRNIPFIPKAFKVGALKYGLEAEWMREGAARNVKSCPLCSKVIAASCIVCPHCTQVVDVQKFAEHQADREKAMADQRKARGLSPEADPASAVTGGKQSRAA